MGAAQTVCGNATSAAAAKAKAATILIVDDAKLLCEGLKRILRTAGFEAFAAYGADSALEYLQKQVPDLVITDLMMPYMSGVELIERLAKEIPDLPCLVITGYATRDRVMRVSRSRNVVGVLVKPVDQNRMIDTINAVLAKREPAPPPVPAEVEVAEDDPLAWVNAADRTLLD